MDGIAVTVIPSRREGRIIVHIGTTEGAKGDDWAMLSKLEA
jgi:hypothetical protein